MNKKLIFFLICLGNITISFNVAAVTAVVPVIAGDLGIPDFLASKVIHYYLLPYGIGALLYAPLTRFFSYRTILSASMILFGLSCFFCARADQLLMLLIGRVGMGVTAAGAIPLGLMMIGDVFERHRRGRLVGLFFSCSFFASLFGIALSGIVDWRILFYIPVALAVLLAGLLMGLKTHWLDKVHGEKVNYTKIFTDFRIRNIFTFIFMVSFLYHGVHKWYGVFLSQDYQLDKLAISVFFIISILGGAFGQLIGGVISDKKGREVSVMIGVLGLGITVILLSMPHSLYMLGTILFLISMFLSIHSNI